MVALLCALGGQRLRLRQLSLVIHGQLRARMSPHGLPYGREGHVKREDCVVTEGLEELVWPRAWFAGLRLRLLSLGSRVQRARIDGRARGGGGRVYARARCTRVFRVCDVPAEV